MFTPFFFIIYIILMLLVLIFTIISLILDRIGNKHIFNIKSIPSTVGVMPKIIKDVTKPPKSLKDFWQIFNGYDEKIQDDMNNIRGVTDEIKNDIINNKKHQNWRTFFAFLTVIVSVSALVIAYCGYIGLIAPPPEHIKASDVRANENIFRVVDIQIYTLTITNYGDKLSNDLRVELEFPNNITINETQNPYGLLISYPEGGKDTNFYKPYYENINVNETIEIRLILKHKYDEFKAGESWGVSPKKLNIWTDDGNVPIS